MWRCARVDDCFSLKEPRGGVQVMKYFHNGEMNGGASFLVLYRVSRAVGSSSYHKPEQAGIAIAVVLLFLIDIGVFLYAYYLIEGHNTRTDVLCSHYSGSGGSTTMIGSPGLTSPPAKTIAMTPALRMRVPYSSRPSTAAISPG